MDNNIPFCFLNVYKPEGITSFDVIRRLRKRFNIKKIGHSGTLDPFADGVMQIAIGNSSRLLEYLNSDKEYIATVKFGYTSSTLDIEGDITKFNEPCFSFEDLKKTIEMFKGKIEQIPPKYSAIKVNGKKLCDIARKNPHIKTEIPKREIEIYDIELIDFKNYEAAIRVFCSKGTYIRTLGNDIAKKLNTLAYLTKLTRIKAGNFHIKDSVKIEDADIEKDAIDPICAIQLQKYELNDEEFLLAKNGVCFQYQNKKNAQEKETTLLLIYKNNLVSIGVLSDNKIKIKKFFNRN